jgi:DNA-binding MurR/RpiR family transcriptional regulator
LDYQRSSLNTLKEAPAAVPECGNQPEDGPQSGLFSGKSLFHPPLLQRREQAMPKEVTFRETIISSFSGLTKKQKEVARFVLDNEYFVAFASVAEVAQKVSVSAATVVRFCQALGYEGYPHLQTAIRQNFPRFKTTVQRLEARLAFPLPESDLLAQVCATDIGNIKHTMELVDTDTFESAVTEIAQATAILVIGEGLSAPPALFFAHSLKVMGFPVRVVTTGGAPLSLALSALRASDLLVGISFWRYFRETVEALYWVREIGVKRIVITDSELSPIAQLADHVFVAASDGVAYSSSPVASLSLINAFVAALSFQRPQQVRTALHNVDAAYRKNRLLVDMGEYE